MGYTYKFIPSGDPIQKNPKTTFKDAVQASMYRQFYESSDWFTIEEETSVGSGVFQNVDVRINGIVNPTTGDNVEEDYKKLIFSNLDHDVSLGRFYKFNNNYWITINVDKIKTLAQTILVKRCNNSLRWIDEATGALYQEPCSISYLIKENRDYATAGSAVVTPSGMVDCFYQINSKTNTIKPNQRFLFGNPSNWTAYRVEGGGINNFNNQETLDNSSATLGRYSLAVDYFNQQTDNLTLGIANYYDNVYSVELNQSSISGGVSQTVQLIATVSLNGETVTRSLSWSSDDEQIATVSSSGLVTFISEGDCIIRCGLLNNTSVYDECNVSVEASPVDNYQIVFSPNSNYVLENSEKTWTAYLYKNNVQQADAVSFSLDSNTVPSSHYSYGVLSSNSFKITNIERFLTDSLDITATSGIHSATLSISLRGAW